MKEIKLRYAREAVSRRTPSSQRRAMRTILKRALLIVFVAGVTTIVSFTILALLRTPTTHAKVEYGISDSLSSRVKRAQAEAAAGRPQQLSLNEAEINSYLASGLGSSRRDPPRPNSGVREVNVHMVDDRINIHVSANFYGQELTMDLGGLLNARNGYMHFVPLSGSVGALPIPASVLRTAVEQAMSSPQAQRNMRLPTNISDLSVEAGHLVVQYR